MQRMAAPQMLSTQIAAQRVRVAIDTLPTTPYRVSPQTASRLSQIFARRNLLSDAAFPYEGPHFD